MDYYNEIRSRFGAPLSTIEANGHFEYQFKCPFCSDRVGTPDKSGHLFVRSDNGVYHCYRCDAKGSLSLSKREISADNVMLLDHITSYIQGNKMIQETKNKFIYTIPMRSIFSNSVALQYMHSRGFTDEELQYYDVRTGDMMSPLIGRVVIPNEVKDKIWTDMYVARTYVNSERRYMNPAGSKSGLSVFNLFRIPDGIDEIIVCEGPITAMAAGKNAVALYGKSINPAKLRMILDKHPKSIVVNLDPDAEHVAVELARTFKGMNSDCKVKLVINPVEMKDAADYKKAGRIDEYHEMVSNGMIFDDIIYKADKDKYRNECN